MESVRLEMEPEQIDFPWDGLRRMAAHFENLGRAWPPDTVTGRALRQECYDRAGVCRDAMHAHAQREDVARQLELQAEHVQRVEQLLLEIADLQGKLHELQHFVSSVASGVIAPA